MLWAELWSEDVDTESMPSIVARLESRPDITARIDELRAARPHHEVAADQLAALTDAVRADPGLALSLALDELRSVERGDSSWLTDFTALFDVLRSLDPRWLDKLIDLLPAEPSIWASVSALLGDESYLIVDRLGVARCCAAWLEAMSSPQLGTHERHWWIVDLLLDLDCWADEALQRLILLALVDGAGDKLLDNVAAGPLEDFLTDDPARLDWMDQQAAQNPRFREALAGVWTSGKSPATAARIAAAATHHAES